MQRTTGGRSVPGFASGGTPRSRSLRVSAAATQESFQGVSVLDRDLVWLRSIPWSGWLSGLFLVSFRFPGASGGRADESTWLLRKLAGRLKAMGVRCGVEWLASFTGADCSGA